MDKINLTQTNELYFPQQRETKTKSCGKNSVETKQEMTLDSSSAALRSRYEAEQLIKDKNELEKINQYNEQIRKPSEHVRLERNPLYQCDIPYQPQSFYRMLGQGGFDDMLTSGIIRPKQNTKENYSMIYLEQGRANNIYARRGGGEYILESSSSKIIQGDGSYPHTETLDPKSDPIRIWHKTQDGYEIVYDTMNDVISRHPDFRYKV